MFGTEGRYSEKTTERECAHECAYEVIAIGIV